MWPDAWRGGEGEGGALQQFTRGKWQTGGVRGDAGCPATGKRRIARLAGWVAYDHTVCLSRPPARGTKIDM